MNRARGGAIAVALGGLLAGLTGLAVQAGERPAWCPTKPTPLVSSALAAFAPLAGKLARRETITLIAIGSSSTEGSDLPDPRQAYPTHLGRQLNAIFGEGRFRVLNKGKGGEAMPETIARFGRDVDAEKPDLVVWQLGVNDVVRRQEPSVSASRIDHGLTLLGAIGAPVVLMDMQFAPSVLRSDMLEPMHRTLKAASLRHGALLWSRFDLMRDIIESGRAGMTDIVREDGLHMTVPMHICAGEKLAESLAGLMSRGTLSAAAPR